MGKALETSMDMINGTSNTVIIANELGYGLQNETVATKKCSRCGEWLPVEQFNKSKATADGFQHYCRACQKASQRIWYANSQKKSGKPKPVESEEKPLLKVYSNTELAKFTPRQLMAELKARGFRWKYMLEPQKKIYFDKI